MAGRTMKLTERVAPAARARVPRARSRDGIARVPRAAIALGMSLLLWLYVSAISNPAEVPPGTVYSAVPVELRNVDPNLLPVGTPPRVTVRVRSIQGIGSSDDSPPTAYVDLRGVGPGTELAPVRVEAPNNVRIVSVTPPQSRVRLEPAESRTMPVRMAGDGVALNLLGTATLEPRQVRVSGASGVISQVEEVVAVVDALEMEPGTTHTVPVQAVDAAGKPVDAVTITPSEVQLKLPPAATPSP